MLLVSESYQHISLYYHNVNQVYILMQHESDMNYSRTQSYFASECPNTGDINECASEWCSVFVNQCLRDHVRQ